MCYEEKEKSAAIFSSWFGFLLDKNPSFVWLIFKKVCQLFSWTDCMFFGADFGASLRLFYVLFSAGFCISLDLFISAI